MSHIKIVILLSIVILTSSCDNSVDLGEGYRLSDNDGAQNYIAKGSEMIIDPAVTGIFNEKTYLFVAQQEVEILESNGIHRFKLKDQCSYWIIDKNNSNVYGPMRVGIFLNYIKAKVKVNFDHFDKISDNSPEHCLRLQAL